ncbi:MAG: Na/Pi cotransporter family protein [Clostridia bacterium]|nr:Na/Pi cotransporter family protein [Clostridia bacterium]
MIDIILQFVKLFGGLGMFLFGMNMMGSGLERAAGNKLQKIMEKVTGNLFKSVLLGLTVTALIQSSSATTVMAVGFVNAGVLTLYQAVGIIMGANIGTTVTAWIISLNDISGGIWYLDIIKPSTLAPVALIIGAVLIMFSKSPKKKVVGELVTGFGILFIGMEYMSDSMDVVFAQVPALGNLFAKEFNPVVGVLVGAGVTAVIQSSSASVGMLQAVASTGILQFNAALPIIMGQNIGTCVTALLSGIGANINARRTSIIHLYFNVIGTALFMTAFYIVQNVVGIPFWNKIMGAADISVFHSCFNIITTLLLLPFAKGLVWLSKKTIKEKETHEGDPFALLDSRFLATPSIAISNAKKAMVNMCNLAHENVVLCQEMMKNRNLDKSVRFDENEDLLDNYEIRLTESLTRISELSLSEEDSERVSSYLRMVTNIERIGDYCDNIREEIVRMLDTDVHFTEKGEKDMNTLLAAIEEINAMTIEAFENCDMELAQKVEPLEEVIDSLQETLESEHMQRLKGKECTAESGAVFLGIISNAERIADHCSNLAVAILQTRRETGVTNRHEYLRMLHATMPGIYKDTYQTYQEKYRV